MSDGQVLQKLLSIGTLVNVWHQTLTSLQLLEKALQLVLDQLTLLLVLLDTCPTLCNSWKLFKCM